LRLLAPVIRTGYAGAMPTRFIGVGKIARKPSVCIASSRQAILPPTLQILFRIDTVTHLADFAFA
jgi:hypothetical protein